MAAKVLGVTSVLEGYFCFQKGWGKLKVLVWNI